MNCYAASIPLAPLAASCQCPGTTALLRNQVAHRLPKALRFSRWNPALPQPVIVTSSRRVYRRCYGWMGSKTLDGFGFTVVEMKQAVKTGSLEYIADQFIRAAQFHFPPRALQ